MSFMILPAADLALPQLKALAATTISVTTTSANKISAFINALFGSTAATQPAESPEDRLLQVRRVRIIPPHFVAYQDQPLILTAIGTNSADQIVQGIRFSWTSSDSERVRVDQTGRVTCIQPGLVTITSRAGSAEATTRILVRPGRRPRQTDAQWRADQASHPDASPSSIGNLLPSLLDSLMPTAYAQSGGYSGNDFAYDEIWTEPRNLVGTPANRAIEPTAIGPVMPESSNFNFTVPINNLNDRGVGASVALIYNGQVWGRHANAVTFSPVGGWISPGFSLGFGHILTYGPTSATRFVWIEPNGTPHYLGTGQGDSYINATYKTTDGSQITFYGNPITGGTLYFNDGTQVTMTVTNNRMLPTETTDSNGNFVRIGYRPTFLYGGSPFEINHINDTQGRTTYFVSLRQKCVTID